MRTLIMISLFLIAPAVCPAQTTWYVPDDFTHIQDAISAASAGDEIIVRPGTYTENIDFLGKEITLKSELGCLNTVIDGGSAPNPDFGSTVSFTNGEGAAAVLEGFTLTAGTGTLENTDYYGGNIFCNGASPTIRNNLIKTCGRPAQQLGGGIACIHQASPTIHDNTITYNIALMGAGIYCLDQSSPRIANNEIVTNESDTHIGNGGGIFCDSQCSPTICGNRISGNRAAIGGAIQFISQSHPVIMDNLISKNRGHTSASGITCSSQCKPTIMNNRIIENDACNWLGSGGGISCHGFSTLILVNNVIADNIVADTGGGIDCTKSKMILVNNTILGNYTVEHHQAGSGIYCSDGSNVEIVNTIIWGNSGGSQIFLGKNSTLTINHSDLMGGSAYPGLESVSSSTVRWGAGMIGLPPQFIETGFQGYHLKYTCPCRDSGDNAAVTELYDFEGDPRIAYGTVDMGADEFHPHLYYTGNAAPGGDIELKFIGLPGDLINGLIVGVNIFDPPLPCDYGLWYMNNPFVIVTGFGSIPAEGVLVYPGMIPAMPPAPHTLYVQAAIDAWLTNLCALEVE